MTRRPSSLMTSLAALAAVVALGISTPARAELLIQLSTDGTTFNTLATGPSGGETGNSISSVPGTDIVGVVTASSNSPGSKSSSFLIGTGTTLVNLGTTTETIYLRLGDTGFKAPTAPPNLPLVTSVDGVATIVPGTGTDIVKFQSFVDPNNGQNTTGPPGVVLEAQPQTFPLGQSGGFKSLPNSLLITNLGFPYSITETVQITLAPGSGLSFATATTLAVPEPSSMAIAGLGMLGIVGYGVRRRRSA